MGFKVVGIAMLVLLVLHCSKASAKGYEEKPSFFIFAMVHISSRYSPIPEREELVREAREGDRARLEAFVQTMAWASSPSSSLQRRYGTAIASGAQAGAGQYFVDLLIGTPPQRFKLIADTGSDLIWVRCSNCRKPCALDNTGSTPTFITRASSTYSPILCLSSQCLLVPPPVHFSCNFRIPSTCLYEYPYADTSNSVGVFSLETLILNSSSGQDVKVPNVAFGCGIRNQGRSFVGSSGVLGLGRGPISFPSQLGGTVSDKFAYCLVDFFHSSNQKSFLLFGDMGASVGSYSSQQLQFTPLLSNTFAESFYYVQVMEVVVNAQVLNIPSYVWDLDALGNRGTVFDSGTTLSFFVEPAYTQILQAMERALVYPKVQPLQMFDLCFDASQIRMQDLLERLPQLEIVFRGNARFRPSPINYFIEVSENGLRCLGLQAVENPTGFSVLGNLMQQNFLIEFDSGGSRLGFTPMQCSHLQV